MELVALLAEARAASPRERIQWRDRIAAYGHHAIDGVKPWLSDGPLAAFAIRVIWRVGERDGGDEASRVLRASRGRLSPALQRDVDWALTALRQSRQVAPKPRATPTVGARRSVSVAREAPRYSQGARRRAR